MGIFFVFGVVSWVFALAYGVLMVVYVLAWRGMRDWVVPSGFRPSTRVSVVVPARNESGRIGACVRAILAGDYPDDLLEVLVVDDHSDDDTAAEAAGVGPQVRVLCLADYGQSGKKAAIETAVAQARGALIVCTDADCTPPPQWLPLLVSAFETRRPAAIAAPVLVHRETNLVQRFQSLDTAGMMLIGGAGMHLNLQRMGNGANLCYPKAVFEAVGGFRGNRHLASGDDMFLLQKIAERYPGGLMFLKNPDAAVPTLAPASWPGFLRQRLRWGGKSTALPEWQTKAVLALVFGLCWCIVLCWAAAGLGLIGWATAAAVTAIKALADFLLLRTASRYFRRDDLMYSFIPAFFIHTLYICVVGLAGLLVRRYTWKGRKTT